EWKNTGQTPARKVRCSFAIESFPMNEDKPPRFSMEESGGVPMDLGPDQTGSALHQFVPLDHLRQQWFRRREIMLWARVEYNDVLQPSKIRHTQYCSRLDFTRDPI